jgi:anti-sigma regulatory factor (Ser/Thr protein kinase)
MHARAQFPPEPRSAAAARHWIREQLNELGRTDLVACAEAGVSELVTNGILHAQTSIGLQISDTRERVVIEVYDGSPMSRQPEVDAAIPGAMESTIGRGLRIVRANAREWGVSTTLHGKAIWFQPAPSPTNGVETAPGASPVPHPATPPAVPRGIVDGEAHAEAAFDLDSALEALAEAFPEEAWLSADITGTDAAPEGSQRGAGEETVEVRLLGVPAGLVHHYRKRWLELVREMQLVALAEDSAHRRMARRFCDAAQAVTPELYVLTGSTGFSTAASDEGAAVDAVFDVSVAHRQGLVEIRDLARELEAHWAGARLLFVHPGPQAALLREWWLGEFIAQIDGAEPTPWAGDLQVHDNSMAARPKTSPAT